MNATVCNTIFNKAIQDYHLIDQVDAQLINPYLADTVEALLYQKCWVDTVQWHLEDLVRDPSIDPVEGLKLKRRIDYSNQLRTDLVEQIDDFLLTQFGAVQFGIDARVNTESPAWAIDRLSILDLKIYHMESEVNRKEATPAHQQRCAAKLSVLVEQQHDLSLSIDQLIESIKSGLVRMKVYRQMKMYNDVTLNPVLYQQKS
jgi:GTP cyclohydrolase FolE2